MQPNIFRSTYLPFIFNSKFSLNLVILITNESDFAQMIKSASSSRSQSSAHLFKERKNHQEAFFDKIETNIKLQRKGWARLRDPWLWLRRAHPRASSGHRRSRCSATWRDRSIQLSPQSYEPIVLQSIRKIALYTPDWYNRLPGRSSSLLDGC